ncbi:hypothetical protein V2H45_12430 [Tumidithrix elongata RA019]|uniref:Sigma-70 family RNA polymerase sigma factor n=1 Tax=Tumidithrix elongata BACA0141 TaxID=2716417 RepID=A0AAW9PSV2_9CYAN|nr:hypothetical protein [Tumidithrix elongata RA019]
MAIEEQLKQLVLETCQHPHGSVGRQKGLTAIVRLVNRSGKLWREATAYYEDALQQTWLYFCRNLCEAITAKAAYDPNQSTVTTWMNAYLKRRLQDMYTETQDQKYKTVPEIQDDNTGLTATDRLEAPSQPSSLLERIREWVEKDPTKKLRKLHVRDRPDVNAQVLICKRLPPESSWQSLSQEFNLPISTLSSFYQRSCLPILKQFYDLEAVG